MLSTITPFRPSQPAKSNSTKSNSTKNTRACREQNGSHSAKNTWAPEPSHTGIVPS